MKELAVERGSLFIPVRLLISEEEHLKRVTEPKRRLLWKSIDPNEVYNQATLLRIKHPHLLEFDVSKLPAPESAKKILKHIEKLLFQPEKINRVLKDDPLY